MTTKPVLHALIGAQCCLAGASAQTGHLWYPENARVSEHADGITLTVPDGWVYLAKRGDGPVEKIAPGAGIQVSCTCRSSGSCNPFYLDGQAGCATENCNSCSMTVSKRGEQQGTISEGAFVVSDYAVRFATEREVLPQASALMFDEAPAVAGLKEFLRRRFGDLPLPELVREGDRWVAPAGYMITVINWGGRGLMMPVPTGTPDAIGGSGGGCSCTQGTCTLKTKWIPGHGTGYFCAGACTGTCTLTVSKISGDPPAVYLSYRF